jgi:hypothetical protein
MRMQQMLLPCSLKYANLCILVVLKKNPTPKAKLMNGLPNIIKRSNNQYRNLRQQVSGMKLKVEQLMIFNPSP